MKVFMFFTLLILGGIFCVNAQQTQPQSTPNPQATPNPVDESRRIIRQIEDANRRFEVLRNSGEIQNRSRLSRTVAFQNIENLYRKPTKEESKRLAPDKEDLKRYAQFLRQSGTGLTRLIADRGCAEYTNVVNVSENCLKLSMPGAGASYSFREETYRIRRLSDLTYIDDNFQSFGILSHAILADVGDVPLEEISLQTNGLKFLTDFETVTEFEKAKETDQKIMKGVKSGGFFYSRNAKASENTTYVLRSIAYRGSFYRTVQGFMYDELDFDERRDLSVAFRIVRRDDESVTILWKKLADQKSPAIKKPEREQSEPEVNKFVAGSEKSAEN